MSLKPWLLALCSFSCLGALVGIVGAAQIGSKQNLVRDIASFGASQTLPNAGKSANFKPASLRFAKPNQAIEVAIESVDGFPLSNDQEAHLRASVKSRLPEGSAIAYRWVLPDGAYGVSGAPEGQIEVRPGQTQVLDFYVRGFSSEGDVRNINLEMNGVDENDGIGAVAVFSSHPTRSDLSRGYRDEESGKSGDPAYEKSKGRRPANVKL